MVGEENEEAFVLGCSVSSSVRRAWAVNAKENEEVSKASPGLGGFSWDWGGKGGVSINTERWLKR